MYYDLNLSKAMSFDSLTNYTVKSAVSFSGHIVEGYSIAIPKLNSSIDTYGSFISSCCVLSKHSGVIHNLSKITMDVDSYAFSSSFKHYFSASKYYFGSDL